MVITDVNQITYNGDGITTAWPFTFPIIDYTDLRLTLINAAGARTDITSDYYVDMVNNTVYYPGYAPGAEPPEANQPPKVQTGEKLEIYRRVPVNQLADLGEKWPFNVIEKGLDKLTMICQDIYSWIGRNIVGLTEDGTAWDAKGLPISNVDGPVNVEDAATKDYVDRILNGFVLAGDSRTVPFDNLAQLKSADIEAGQISFSLGYHDINDGGAGVYNIRAKTPYDVDNGGSIIFLANGNVAELLTDGTVNVKQFGAAGDGVTDDTTALANAINSGYNVYVPKGHYICTSAITNTIGLTMYGDGDESIIDFGDSLPSGTGLTISGSLTQIADITNTVKGEVVESFTSAHGLSVGDVFCIFNPTDYSWSGWRAYYRAGEWCKVVAVNGNTVTLSNPFYDTYAGTDVDVYKMNSVPVDLHDFKIVGTSTHELIKVSCTKDVQISNVSSTLEKYDCIYLDRCYDVQINDLNLFNKGTNDNDYGLIIGNSQRVTVNGGYFYGRRHGITTGGSSYECCVSCRQIYINNAIMDNDYSLANSSNGVHGNIEDSVFDSCVFYNSANSAGKDLVIRNCTIVGGWQVSCIKITEPNGGNHIFENNVIKTPYETTNIYSDGWVRVTNISDAIQGSALNIIFKNNVLDIQKSVANQVFMYVQNATEAYTGKINIIIDGLEITGNSNLINFIRAEKINNATVDNSDYIVVDNITGDIVSGSSFLISTSSYMLTVPMRLMKQAGVVELTIPSGSNRVTSAFVDYKIKYPVGKTPVSNTRVTDNAYTPTNSYLLSVVYSCQYNKIRPTMFTYDSSNATSDVTKNVSWEVEVNEV